MHWGLISLANSARFSIRVALRCCCQRFAVWTSSLVLRVLSSFFPLSSHGEAGQLRRLLLFVDFRLQKVMANTVNVALWCLL
mmetsp:Transcript_60453/g.168890  ORF Transcript_60453/g.168890 Transcript_60453/m.168890 type:complete len:82 (-) Transcript_60453:24-269(-)